MPRAYTEVERTNAFWSKVNRTEGCWEWDAGITTDGYGGLRWWAGGKGYTAKAHRVAFELEVGAIPDGMILDHICHNRKCVRPDHLRPVTNKQNLENQAGARIDSKTGFRGVVWSKKDKLFRAIVIHNYKAHYAGGYRTAEEANVAAKAMRNKLYTHNDADRLKGES